MVVYLIVFVVFLLPILAGVAEAMTTEHWAQRRPLLRRALRLPLYLYAYGIVAIAAWAMLN